MSIKILVTGGCGYIGGHTIVALLNKGFDVVSIDNMRRGRSYVPDRVRQITGKTFRNYEVDLCDQQVTTNVFSQEKDIAGIIHFAAYKMVGESVADPLMYYHNNLFSQVHIMECMRQFQIPHLIFSSSSSVYGNIARLPVTEDTSVVKQESPYGRTKFWGEMMIEDFVKAFPCYALALRYFNPVGSHASALLGEPMEEKPQNIVPAITKTAIGKQPEFVVFGSDLPTRDGSCIRDYPHVMDVADAHVLALEFLVRKKQESPSFFDIINLGTSNGVSVLEMVHAFEKATGIALKYRLGPRREGDAIAVYSDITKAEKMLGWKPSRSLEEVMRSAWQWELRCSDEVS
ncbi:MAG: UDP-glucose 4-epimerase GalE [Chitinophagales bacterium]|nr:UDP-glucose 4-epimerase GalE [Chitinophagales bacterium]